MVRSPTGIVMVGDLLQGGALVLVVGFGEGDERGEAGVAVVVPCDQDEDNGDEGQPHGQNERRSAARV